MRRSPVDPKDFEIEVRNIAREIWDSQGYDGSITLGGRERDSIFITEEVVHYIEITTSKSEKKAKDDLKKISDFMPVLNQKFPGKIAKGWWITLHEPTGEQGAHISLYDGKIFHQTYHQFLAKLIDSRKYLSLREKCPFGSARNIQDGDFDIPSDEYVPSMLVDQNNGETIGYLKFRDSFTKRSNKSLITGEFGVGKSMFARELFFELASAHKSGRDNAFPIYINLRDHGEQKDPDECLLRHGKSIGMPNPDHLVRAWRAGYTYLILDGFDELTPALATRSTRRAKDVRRSAVELVRRFVDQTPKDSSVMILGRSNFFDHNEDISNTLGLKKNWDNFVIPDFNEIQTRKYLEKKGHKDTLPSWLPKRPLLIGYLVSSGLFDDKNNSDAKLENDRIAGWNELLNKVCEREVSQVYLALDAQELREIYGRIGTKSRKKSHQLGPISLVECKDAFTEVMEVEPEGRSLIALMRLPGLVGMDIKSADDDAISGTHPGSRWFVDESFQNAVASLDVYKAIERVHDFDHTIFKSVNHPLNDLGIEAVISNFANHDHAVGVITNAIEAAASMDASNPVLLDFIYSLKSLNRKCMIPRSKISNIQLKDLVIDEDNIIDMKYLTFENCYIENLKIWDDDLSKIPNISGCLIESVESHLSEQSISSLLIDNNSLFDSFSQKIYTYEEFKSTCKDDRLIALCSVLERVFIQSRKGRLDSALRRGLTPRQMNYIDDVIEIARKEGYIEKVRRRGEIIWDPNLSLTNIVKSILKSPENSKTQVVKRCLEL
ncbi:NACHT domain-containing protein [Thalassospira sp. SN3W]|uniref:NACHT domain-containing protein n=1 Tax=Thalassospira sp. SN3W TaxID=3035476 RepID=UPI00311B14ED